jgi:transcriptional regulator GlxA family with amidase domain
MPATALLPHLRAAKDLMDLDYAQPIDLDALARRAHCSRCHFLRSFRTAYGETPRAYLTRRRIERAKDLLRSANLTVTEACIGGPGVKRMTPRRAALGRARRRSLGNG